MKILRKKMGLFNYNIGFLEFQGDLTFKNQNIKWLQHTYKNRFFADPFILSVTKDFIEVLVEDFSYKSWKGKISLLTVDRKTYKLLNITPVLDLETHLSFPFIYRLNEDVYIIPENSESGCLNIYKYNSMLKKAILVKTLLHEGVIDPVIYSISETSYLLFGSLKDDEPNKNLYLWKSNSLLGDYVKTQSFPIKSDRSCSRRGGDFFIYEQKLFSVSQCCKETYGESLNISKVDNISPTCLDEVIVSVLHPDKQYKYGLHTFNMFKDMCVVDGLTYVLNPYVKLLRTIGIK